MTTPRIEEMVEEGQKIVCDYLDEVRRLLAGLPGEVKPHTFTTWLRTALTEAHQAGRDEAVEKIVNTIASKPYAFDLAEERLQVLQAIKALQDNK